MEADEAAAAVGGGKKGWTRTGREEDGCEMGIVVTAVDEVGMDTEFAGVDVGVENELER